jgi:hypothetical protein
MIDTKPEIIGIKRSYGEPATIMTHERFMLTIEARFAMALIERWGLVAAQEDGEDSAGRQKVRLSSIKDVVDRAANTAALAIKEFSDRGWMVDVPSYDDVTKLANDRRKSEKDTN